MSSIREKILRKRHHTKIKGILHQSPRIEGTQTKEGMRKNQVRFTHVNPLDGDLVRDEADPSGLVLGRVVDAAGVGVHGHGGRVERDGEEAGRVVEGKEGRVRFPGARKIFCWWVYLQSVAKVK